MLEDEDINSLESSFINRNSSNQKRGNLDL